MKAKPRRSKKPRTRSSLTASPVASEEAETDAAIEALSNAFRFGFDPRLGEELYAGSGPDKPTTVVIDVDSENARAATSYKWNATQKVRENRDGSVRITFTCDDCAPVIAWILRHGSHAVAIRPPALVEAVAAQIRATVNMYSDRRKRP